jgi:hypothetical protein
MYLSTLVNNNKVFLKKSSLVNVSRTLIYDPILKEDFFSAGSVKTLTTAKKASQ